MAGAKTATHLLPLAARFVGAADRPALQVSVEGGPAEALPMPEAGSGDYSPDGAQMVYSPQSRDFRSEKRYGGGQANALYIFDLKTNATKRITEGPRATRDPMWIGDTIYYNSDRDGHFNLYSYNVGSGKTTQVTRNKTWDVRWPSSDQRGPHRLRDGMASCRSSTRRAERARRFRSLFPTKVWRAGPVASLRPIISSLTSSARRASAHCSPRAATSSPRRSKKGRRAI